MSHAIARAATSSVLRITLQRSRGLNRPGIALRGDAHGPARAETLRRMRDREGHGRAAQHVADKAIAEASGSAGAVAQSQRGDPQAFVAAISADDEQFAVSRMQRPRDIGRSESAGARKKT